MLTMISGCPYNSTKVLVILLFLSLPDSINTFRPTAMRPESNHLLNLKPVKPPSKHLWVSNRGIDEDLSGDSDELLKSPFSKPKDPQGITSDAVWKRFKNMNNKFWDYTCNFLYVGISCLIFLNLCGFGYTISREEGVNVMPLKTYRQERQWRQEIQREQNHRPSRPLSTIHQGPVTTLLSQHQGKQH